MSDAVAIHCQKRETDNCAQKMQRNYSTTQKMLKKPEELTHIEILRLWRKLINETATSVSALLEEEKNTVFLFFCSKRQSERERDAHYGTVPGCHFFGLLTMAMLKV